MKRTTLLGMMFALVAGMLSLTFSAPAMADTVNGVTCNPYRYLYPNDPVGYPNDFATANQTDTTGHLYVCGNVTRSGPSAVRGAVYGLPYGAGNPVKVRDLLQSRNVTYFYFVNRADANNYMKGKAPYSQVAAFQSSTARCGNTGYGIINGSSLIASEIYDTCQLAGTTISNPNVEAVALHESGHAFDFSVASVSANPAVPPSLSRAFRNLFNDSTNTGKAASDVYYLQHGDATHPVPNTCGVFDSVMESALELDLGLPTANSISVCTGSTINSPYVGKNNWQIAVMQDPYFVSPSSNPYEELFAEMFAVQSGRIGSPPPVPLIDKASSSFRCTHIAMYYWFNYVEAPPTANLTSLNCPIPGANDWNSQ